MHDIIGQRFGRLTVREFVQQGKRALYRCVCECGNVVDLNRYLLNNGNSRSCGCLKKAVLGINTRTHGETVGRKITTEYRAWVSIKERTGNPSYVKFATYGGRGITMHPEWQNDFQAFLAAVGRRPADKSSIGRIDVDKGYIPGNVRWEDNKQQARSKTNNVWFEYEGQRLLLHEVAALCGFTRQTLSYTIKRNSVSLDEAIALLRLRRSGLRPAAQGLIAPLTR